MSTFLMNQTLLEQLQQRVNVTEKSHFNPDWKYARFEELVLDCGSLMEPEREQNAPESGLLRNCYGNCQKLASMHSELIYCEGYALSQEIDWIMPHGWVINSESKVFEVTWSSPGRAYCGVAFNLDWVQSLLKRRQQKGRDNYLSVFECNHLEKYSFLKEGLPSEAYRQPQPREYFY